MIDFDINWRFFAHFIDFVSFQVTHLWHDEAIRKIDDHKDYEKVQGCFYRGRVRGDDRSVVSVSLCGGMVSMPENILLTIVDKSELTHRFFRESGNFFGIRILVLVTFERFDKKAAIHHYILLLRIL